MFSLQHFLIFTHYCRPYTYQTVGNETISNLFCNCVNVESLQSTSTSLTDKQNKSESLNSHPNKIPASNGKSSTKSNKKNKAKIIETSTDNAKSPEISFDDLIESENESLVKCAAPQDPTTMPWHLAHKAKLKPNEKETSYARLHWDGLFPGGIITPSPINQEQVHYF